MSPIRALATVLVALGAAADVLAAACSAQSGEGTAALVELYTSEGCDSCPPADRWLASLASRGFAPVRVVPIALHVDYWDYIGWKDPYAKREFAERQRRLAHLKRATYVFTPQVLLQGQDFRRWGTAAFDEAVAQINARPAKARIALRLEAVRARTLEVEARAELLEASQREDAALYLASYENRLVSQVGAGENRGRTLAHDYVVFEWQGPVGFASGTSFAGRHSLPLLPQAVPAHSGVVAFVQNRRTAEVLQALMLPACR